MHRDPSKVDITRRQLVTAAACVVGSALVPETVLLRRRTDAFKSTMTTLFWVGEPSDSDNAFIPNDISYWDKEWQVSYGGVDDPLHRNSHWPADFTPKENPFYVALPYGEFESIRGHELKANARNVPWYNRGLSTLLKNHWVEVKLGARTCYAQWQDVGPFEVDDFAFVFGSAEDPQNTFDAKAGLDVSPAVWHYLGMSHNEFTTWRFSDAADVPPGPWTEIVTTSGNNRLI